MNTKRIILSSLALGLAGASATAADAHVTLQPKTAAAGAYVVEAVRVPNETDDAVTTKVAVQFPAGFASASYQTTPGWSVKVTHEKLATPVKTDDGEITEGVKTITWTADSKAKGIAPGQFRDFPISVQIPGKAGDTLTFKALQTYSDGEVVRWIGAPDADKPAPTIAVTAAADEHGTAAPAGGTATNEQTSAPTAAATPGAASTSDDDSSNTLAIIALIVGALGLLAGGAGLASARRRP